MNSKIDLEKYFYWTAYDFFAIFFLYALFSEIVFFSITGGWAMLFSLILYVWIFPVLLCLLGFASWCSRYDGSYINQKLFLILAILILIFQILAILFNVSDCGDGGRGYYFIETIIYNKTPACHEPALFAHSVRRYSISFRYIYYLLNFILVLLFIYGQRLSIKIEKQQKQQLRKARQEIKDLAPIFIRAIQHTRTDGKPLDYSPVKIVGNLHCKNLYFENIYYFISVTNNPEYNCSKLTIERKQPTGNKIILSLNFRANFDTRPGLNNIMILENHVSKNDRILLQFLEVRKWS